MTFYWLSLRTGNRSMGPALDYQCGRQRAPVAAL